MEAATRVLKRFASHRPIVQAFVTIALSCLAWHSDDARSASSGTVVFDSARLFHAAPRLPRRAWTDQVKAGVQELVLDRSDGVVLRGWFYPSRTPDAPYVLTFHGNNGTIVDTDTLARDGFFHGELALNVVTFDYRGTGFSDGAISLEKARADALAIYDFAAKKAAGRKVFVCGWSMGSIFASHVAASRASVTGLILLDPISTADALASHWSGLAHSRLVPDRQVAQGIDNPAELANYRNPLLVVHGDADHVVPIEQGRADYASAGSADKTFVPIPEKDHVDAIWSIEADNAIAAFVAKH